jgi:hypothetical protein
MTDTNTKRTHTFDPAAIAISAIENVSAVPVVRDDIRRMLSTGEGEPSHVMALFSDVDYTVLLRLAIAFGISDDDFARAYIHARDAYAAANSDFDAFVREMEAVWQAEKARGPAGASKPAPAVDAALAKKPRVRGT